MQEPGEVVHTIERLQSTFEDLAIRGLGSLGPEQISILKHFSEELEEIGASHMSGKIQAIIDALNSGNRDCAKALMRAQSSLRVFDRILTLETASEMVSVLATQGIADKDEGLAIDDDDDDNK